MRDPSLTHSDSALLTQCDVDTYRASGPGGQKRNKTSSGVRLRHRETGVSVHADESRSQHENRAAALRRLRRALALRLRDAPDLTEYTATPQLAQFIRSAGRNPGERNPERYQSIVQRLGLRR